MGSLVIGLDVGQKVDPTAIVVAEADLRDRADGLGQETHFTVRYLERLALGTSYPELARFVKRVVDKATDQVRPRPTTDAAAPRLYLDATGVGTPVYDALREAGVWAWLYPCYFTHGDRLTYDQEVGSVKVGKAYLVSRLQSLLQFRRVHLPKDHPDIPVLTKELLDYEIRVDQDANDKYGAFKVGTHDDLVTALGLACLYDFDQRGGITSYDLVWKF